MVRLLTFFILWFSSSALATLPIRVPQITEMCISDKVDFQPARNTLATLSLPLQMLSATVKIEIAGSRCSAATVSDKGHLLTGGHCVERCLKDFYKTKNGISALDPSELSQASCIVTIDGKSVMARVLATNRCPSEVWKNSARGIEACGATDYALLELDGPRDGPCFQISNRLAGPGQTVAAIGFPGPSKRAATHPGAQDSDGTSAYMSVGMVIKPAAECQKKVLTTKGVMTAPTAFVDSEIVRSVMKEAEEGRVIQTSVDILGGSSGGPLVGRYSGSLVGVASFFRNEHHNTTAECPGSTFFTSASHILKHVEKHYPTALSAFHCRERAFVKAAR